MLRRTRFPLRLQSNRPLGWPAQRFFGSALLMFGCSVQTANADDGFCSDAAWHLSEAVSSWLSLARWVPTIALTGTI